MGSVIVKAQRETTVIIGGEFLEGTRLAGRTLVKDHILFCSLLQNKPRYHFDSEALHVYTELKFRYGWVRDLGTVITAFSLICAVNVQRER